FLKVATDADRRGTDTALVKTHCLCDDLVGIGDADIRETVSDEHHAIDALIEHAFADSQATTHARFVQCRRATRRDSRYQILHRLFIRDRLAREKQLDTIVKCNYAEAIARQHL